MDYTREYIIKNPNMHLEHSELKTEQILLVLPKDKKYKRVLDVACGAGQVTLNLEKIIKPENITGIDISELMIEKAKSLDLKNKVSWEIIDIFNFKKDNKFDLIICADIIEHLENDLDFLLHLKKLGKNIILRVPLEDSLINRILMKYKLNDPFKSSYIRYGHIQHYSEESILNLISKSGIKIIKQVEVVMPKRSMFIWEAIRLLLFPISFVSKRLFVNTVGGFKIFLLET